MIFSYFIRVDNYSAAASAAALQIEHTYYKHTTIASAIQRSHEFNKTWGQYKDLHPASLGNITVSSSRHFDVKKTHPAALSGNPSVNPPPYNASAKLEELSHFIFKHGDDRSRARALLCNVFHHAIHDRYYPARDMFLISHIHDTVDKMDIKTQILYNRAVVMLGLSAFRLGLIQKAHDALSGICSGKLKELLAQGHGKHADPDQERIERRRQLPYHMHINPDLLECVHLISAMLLELPNLAKTGGLVTSQPQQNIVSKHFRKYFQGYSRQILTGPPENPREHVLAAAKALLNGKWKKARSLVVDLEVWNLLPGDGADKVRNLLKDKIKEEGVRIYLLTYGAHFESISLQHIQETFELEASVARRIISRMIFNKEISAAWEYPADTLILYKVDPSPVQTAAQIVADRVTNTMESNERLLDPFSGLYGYKDDNNYNRDGRNKQYADDKQYKKPWKQGNGAPGRGAMRVVSNRGRRNPSTTNKPGNGNVWTGQKHVLNKKGGPNQSN